MSEQLINDLWGNYNEESYILTLEWATLKITEEWLHDYSGAIDACKDLFSRKLKLIKKISSLKSIDYTKDKVINGNNKHASEEEIYILRLENINEKITLYKKIIITATNHLKTNIRRLKNNEYGNLIIQRFIYKKTWKEVEKELFGNQPDYEDEKDFKYWDKTMRWRRAALKALEDLSEKPYIPANQLHIGVQL